MTADLAALETFFDAFAAGIRPLPSIWMNSQQSSPTYPVVLWLAARETSELGALHQQLNAPCKSCSEARAAFDGHVSLPHDPGAFGRRGY
jgi:hypothetical protein